MQLILKNKRNNQIYYTYIGNGIRPILLKDEWILNEKAEQLEQAISQKGIDHINQIINYRKERSIESKMADFDHVFGFNDLDPNIESKQIQIEILRQLALANFLKAYELDVLDEIQLI